MTAEDADHGDDAALAGEYVLGLLSAEDAAAFETRLNREPALRALVADWSAQFAALTDPLPEVAPPASVKAALDARLFPAPTRRSPFGFLIGLVGGVVAAVALILAVALVNPPVGGPIYQARIAADAPALLVLARLEAKTGRLTVSRSIGAPAAGHSLELWLIAPGGGSPVSLGVIDPAETEIEVPEALRAGFEGGTLAISEEPPGGSPSGAPTRVLAAGPAELVAPI